MKKQNKILLISLFVIIFVYWVTLYVLNIIFSFSLSWQLTFSTCTIIGVVLGVVLLIVNFYYVYKQNAADLNKDDRKKRLIKGTVLRLVYLLCLIAICAALSFYNKSLNTNVYEELSGAVYEYSDDEITISTRVEDDMDDPILTIINKTENITNEYYIYSISNKEYGIKIFILDNIDSDKPDIVLTARRYLGNRLEIEFSGINDDELGFLNLKTYTLQKIGDGSMS